MIVGFVRAITWIIFPFIVISKCNQIARVSRESLRELQGIRLHLASPLKDAPPPPSVAAADVQIADARPDACKQGMEAL
jgi:hypothetical protein